MTITENKEGSAIKLSVEGRADTNTSPELQDQILKAFQKSDQVIIDFTELEYISSAGLRALLLGHKTATSKGGNMIIRGANEDVLEIFDDTGFIDVFEIEGLEDQ